MPIDYVKTNTPKISVCMPVYNGSAYIKEAIASVLNQSFSDFEFIIVDDSSSDNTLKLVNSYNDKRIKIFRNEKRLGQVPNYNKSMGYAKGEYVKLMHQDDILNPRCLEAQVKALEENIEAAVVFSNSHVVDEKLRVIFKRNLPFKQGLINKGEIVKKFIFRLDFNFIGEPPIVLLRRDALNITGLFNEKILIFNDLELWIRINIKYPCFHLNETLATIRMHKNQICRKYRKSIISAMADNYQLCSVVIAYSGISALLKFCLFLKFISRFLFFPLGRITKKIIGAHVDTSLVYYFWGARKK